MNEKDLQSETWNILVKVESDWLIVHLETMPESMKYMNCCKEVSSRPKWSKKSSYNSDPQISSPLRPTNSVNTLIITTRVLDYYHQIIIIEYYNYSLCVSLHSLVTLDTVKSYVDQLKVKLLEVCLSLNNFHLKMMCLKALECTFLNFLRHEKYIWRFSLSVSVFGAYDG